VTEVVLDASAVLKWFRADGERHLAPARALRATFEAGKLAVAAPSLLKLEIVNLDGRRWTWGEDALADLAGALAGLGFEFDDPELARVAAWTARGLTAYVALAEARATTLITDDDLIVSLAGGGATALADTPR
jgi:hypothetical protein